MNKFLYVGCGNHRLSGFTHVEIDFAKTFSKGDIVSSPEIMCDITDKIPLNDNSVDLIFSRETYEHLKYRELINCLIESHRVLKKGGLMRIGVPDLDKYIHNYIDKKEDVNKAKSEWHLDPDFPIENHSDLFVARIMYTDHYYNHNFETLSNALKNVGFSNITRNKPGEIDISNQVIKGSIFEAENESKEFLLILTAQKTRETSLLQKYSFKLPQSFLNRILKKFFNLKLVPSNHRMTFFPQKTFFLEKIEKLKNLFKF